MQVDNNLMGNGTRGALMHLMGDETRSALMPVVTNLSQDHYLCKSSQMPVLHKIGSALAFVTDHYLQPCLTVEAMPVVNNL